MQALGDKKVLLIGVGGVGSHVAAALCRAGIGQLEIVDFDVVDESNLGRQYYDVNDQPKYPEYHRRSSAISPRSLA